MECNCCHAAVAEGVAKCPSCGFPVLAAGDGSPEYNRILTEFRSKRLSQIIIEMQVYSYEVSSSGVSEAGSAWHTVGLASALKAGEVVWSDLDCEALPSDRSFTVRLRIRNGGTQREQAVTFSPGRTVSRSCIGLAGEDVFTFRLAVGSKEDYILSDTIRMLS